MEKAQRTGSASAQAAIAGRRTAGCAAELLHDGPSGKKKVSIQSAASIGWATSDDESRLFTKLKDLVKAKREAPSSLFETILQKTDWGIFMISFPFLRPWI